MDDLIEALQIFAKYSKKKYPTYCAHDVLCVCGVRVFDVTAEDKARLKELSFEPGCESDNWDKENECYIFTETSDTWSSYRFGST